MIKYILLVLILVSLSSSLSLSEFTELEEAKSETYVIQSIYPMEGKMQYYFSLENGLLNG